MLGAPSEAERDAASLALLDYGLLAVPARDAGRARASRWPACGRAIGTTRCRSRRARRSRLTSRAGQHVSVGPRARRGRGPDRRRASARARGRSRSTASASAAIAAGRRAPGADGRGLGATLDAAIPGAAGGRLAAVIAVARARADRRRSRLARLRRAPDRSAVRRAPRAGRRVILTVTLNAAIDRTVAVPNFRLGQRHRAVEARTVAGGKGVNVARALKLLGRPVIATGLAGGATGTRILEQLAEESILNEFTRIAGESRTNLAVVDPTSGEQTEINERGPEVSAEEVDRFVEKLLYLAQGASICVLAGQRPAGRRRRRLRAAGRRAARPRRADRARHRRRADARRPARRARGGRARTCARPRRRSATSSTTPTTSRSASPA